MPSEIKSLKPQTWTSWEGERKSKRIYLDVDIFHIFIYIFCCSRAGIAKKKKRVKFDKCTVLFFYVFQNNLVFWVTSLMILHPLTMTVFIWESAYLINIYLIYFDVNTNKWVHHSDFVWVFFSWMSYGPLTPKIIIVVPESYKANLV